MPRLMAYSPNAFTYHETIGLLVAADFPCLQASFLTHILGHPRRTETEVGIGTKRGCWFRSFMSFLQTDFKSIVLSDIEHLKKNLLCSYVLWMICNCLLCYSLYLISGAVKFRGPQVL